MPAPSQIFDLLRVASRARPDLAHRREPGSGRGRFLHGPAILAEDGYADCHEDEPDPAACAASVHDFVGCVDCHTGAEEIPHSEDGSFVDLEGVFGTAAAEAAVWKTPAVRYDTLPMGRDTT